MKTATSGKDAIAEAKRYLANAREILKTKAGNGVPGYYSDSKYVKMACHKAWSGVLVALDSKISPLSKGKRKSVDTYKEFLAPRNKKILNDLLPENYIGLAEKIIDKILKA